MGELELEVPVGRFPCEASALAKSHDTPGLFSMANAGPNTGGSQFFLTTVPTPWLDGNHAVFGKVVKGMENVHKIENCDTQPGDRPYDPQKIIKVERFLIKRLTNSLSQSLLISN